MKNNIIYIKGIKALTNTVLCLGDSGQKTYYDPISNKVCGFGSGTQVKRCIREKFVENLGKQLSHVTLNYSLAKGALKQNTSIDNTDPSEFDSLVCGWMVTGNNTLTRTSPLMISPFTPLHPELSSINNKELHTFSRLDNTNSISININKGDGDKASKLSEEEIRSFLSENERNMPTFLIEGDRCISGMYKFEIGVDMRTLCCVQLNDLKRQISNETEVELVKKGWSYGLNYFGKCLILPKNERIVLFKALADAIIDWEINTHRSFNNNPQLTEAVSISYNSRMANGAIHAEKNTLIENNSNKEVVTPIIDEDYCDHVFVEKSFADSIKNSKSIAMPMAMEKAKEQLVKMMLEFDYDQYIINND